MITRNFLPKDEIEVRELWKQNNTDDVFLPDLDKLTNKAVIVENDKIIAFACINYLPELIVIHNKSLSIKLKYKVVRHLFDIFKGISKKMNYIQLYCFSNTPTWMKRGGFKPYKIYYLELRDK